MLSGEPPTESPDEFTHLNKRPLHGIEHVLRRLLWRITRRKGWFANTLYRGARSYSQAYRDYSYEATRNGEARLLRQMSILDPETVFDVGANVGEWTELALLYFPAATCHAFELASETRSVFCSRVTSARAAIVPAGLGSQTGPVTFKEFGNCSGLNTIVTDTTHHDWRKPVLRKAMVYRGDSYCRDNGISHIDLLKVDVEGFEGPVLEGFGDMLTPEVIRCVQFEYGYGNGDIRWLMKDFGRFFEDRGYGVGKLWHNGVGTEPFAYEWNNFDSGPNYVAFGRDDSELKDTICRGR